MDFQYKKIQKTTTLVFNQFEHNPSNLLLIRFFIQLQINTMS